MRNAQTLRSYDANSFIMFVDELILIFDDIIGEIEKLKGKQSHPIEAVPLTNWMKNSSVCRALNLGSSRLRWMIWSDQKNFKDCTFEHKEDRLKYKKWYVSDPRKMETAVSNYKFHNRLEKEIIKKYLEHKRTNAA